MIGVGVKDNLCFGKNFSSEETAMTVKTYGNKKKLVARGREQGLEVLYVEGGCKIVRYGDWVKWDSILSRCPNTRGVQLCYLKSK